jgi:hypothetical protein
MTAPLSLRRLTPVASAQPVRAPQPLTRAEVRDAVFTRADGPRGYGSQLSPWQGGSR